jgi:hypothetical protein
MRERRRPRRPYAIECLLDLQCIDIYQGLIDGSTGFAKTVDVVRREKCVGFQRVKVPSGR